VTQGPSEQHAREVSTVSSRTAARAAWSMWALALLSFAVSGVLRLLNASTPTVEPRTPLVLDFWYLLLFMSFATVGALVASRRPGNAIGWIFCYLGLSFPLVGAGEEYALYALVTEPGSLPGGEGLVWLAAVLSGPIVFAVFALVFLLFPEGRLLSRRWRLVIWLDLIAAVCLLTWAFEPGPLENLGLVRLANPFGMERLAALLGILGMVGLLMTLAVAVAGGISLVVRFRRARGVERQQLKWFAFSGVVFCAVFAIGPVLWSLPESAGPGWVWPVLFLAGSSTIPVSVGIAILRYRLYDIDILINRALVYIPLTATLVALYFGGIVLLQRLFLTLTGGQSTLAVVASTLLIAALFNPLRRRIQSFIDRRFYRSKYDARKTLEAFSARLRDETDLEALNNELVGVVRETMQPAHVSLWLRSETVPKGEHKD
jgi:hypothetical protein